MIHCVWRESEHGEPHWPRVTRTEIVARSLCPGDAIAFSFTMETFEVSHKL